MEGKELPYISKSTRKMDSSGSVIEEEILTVKGPTLKECKEVFDKRWEENKWNTMAQITSKKELDKALKKKSIIIRHSKKDGMVPIPISVFNDELRTFFKKKKLGDEYGTPKHYTLSEAN